MTPSDRRRRSRFVAYFEAKFQRDRAKLIDQSCLSKGRIAQLFNENETFGERAGRNLALALGLDEDFFEHDYPRASAHSVAEAPAPDYRATPEFTNSDLSLLRDLKVLPEERRREIRAEASRWRALTDEVIAKRIAAGDTPQAAGNVTPLPEPRDSRSGLRKDARQKGRSTKTKKGDR